MFILGVKVMVTPGAVHREAENDGPIWAKRTRRGAICRGDHFKVGKTEVLHLSLYTIADLAGLEKYI